MGEVSDRTDQDLVKNSLLYREFRAEREEILKHKWIESEKVGYDVGFEWALTDWILKHRSKWRAARKNLHPEWYQRISYTNQSTGANRLAA
jgi:hypothetical protein